MKRNPLIGLTSTGLLLAATLVAAAQGPAPALTPSSDRLLEEGKLELHGQLVDYRIRRLPLSSFPELPAAFAYLLAARGCMVPQNYAAHGPENVVAAHLESAGSSDWAALCSSGGQVFLFAYFPSQPNHLVELTKLPERDLLAARPAGGFLEFAWSLHTASPARIRDAQAGLAHRPQPAGHDALIESLVDGRAVYHYFTHEKWTTLEVSE